jgi:mevalonate kinase
MSTGSGYGKVILLGEHAVVYGVPAVAVGIDRGVRATAKPLGHGPSTLSMKGWGISVGEDDAGSDLSGAFRALVGAVRGDRPRLGAHLVEIEADLPPGGGLGCSAAMGVAIARALDSHCGDAVLQERAMAWERVFHGNPSGIDAAVSARGGCALFRKGEGLQPLRARGTMHLCVASTGTASGTKTMVDAVKRFRARAPEVVDEAFEAIRGLVQAARSAIESGDWLSLGRLMDRNQAILGTLSVSTPVIERICSVARDAGACGAKLTGAGGGGSVVALVTSSVVAQGVLAAWKAAGFDGFETRVAQPRTTQSIESETAP